MFPIFAAAATAAALSPISAREDQVLSVACSSPSVNQATLEHLGSIPTEPWMVSLKDQGAPIVALANTGEILGYTRIRVDFRACPGADRRWYPAEKRFFLTRKFLGKHLEKSFQLSIKLSPTAVDVSPTLINIKRDSDSKGESWATVSDNGDIPTPYFRIDTGSKVLLTPAILSKRDYQSEIGSGILDLITKATAAIAPPVTLITSENKDRFNQAAAFVDSTINGLLHVEINEKAQQETALNPGTEGQVLAIYTVQLPFANDAYATKLHPEQPIGAWAVIAEPVRVSMFGTVTGGHLSGPALTPASVLGYSVAANKTVRETLSGAQDVVSARDELVKAADNEVEDKAYRLCRAIQNQAETLEMTPIDGGAIAWAYVRDLAFGNAKEGKASRGCARIGNYPR
jgi:hypothetical protein